MFSKLDGKRVVFFIVICLYFLPLKLQAENSNYCNKNFSLFICLNDEFTHINNSSIDSEFLDFEENVIHEVYDPLEKLNRKFFNFSLWVDKSVINKIDIAYKYVVPKYIRVVSVNMVNNFEEPLNAINHLLQFKFISFLQVTCRFILNSTLGLFGAIDVASTLNLNPNPNDFGYTLTYYHLGEGFYIFVPLLGPYTLKTGVATIISGVAYSQILQNMVGVNQIYTYLIVSSSRAFYYLENSSSFKDVLSSSVDGYCLMKFAYTQNRRFRFEKLKQSW